MPSPTKVPTWKLLSAHRQDEVYRTLGPGWHLMMLGLGLRDRAPGWWLCRFARPLLWLGWDLAAFSGESFRSQLLWFQQTRLEQVDQASYRV